MLNQKWIIKLVVGVFLLSIPGFSIAQKSTTGKKPLPPKKAAPVVKKKETKKKETVKKAVNRKSMAKPSKKKLAKKKTSARKSLKAWLKKLKKRATRIRAKRNQIVSVAAVRGAEKPDSPPLYWKGKKKGKIGPAELKEFEAALDLAIKGENDKAKKQLLKFQKNHPKSALSKDVNHTLKMINEEK